MTDTASLRVHLHPLVLINISDHVVRYRCSPERQSSRAIGALIGAQEGRRVDLHNSFELAVEEPSDGQARSIDLEFFNTRLAQYMENFPRYEFLGWYSTGVFPEESDKILHKKIQEVTGNDNPFLILLDTETMLTLKASQSEQLPIKVYDSTSQIDQGETKLQWTEVNYAIDTLEAERIAVNHVAKSATTATAGHSSDFTQHTSGLTNSVVMLSNRVKELLKHIEDVKAGRAEKNHDVLRQTLSICQALQAVQPEALEKEFCEEFNDASLIVLLATMTKAAASTSDLIDKLQLAYESRRHRSRHHYPFG
eukprot:TRINITY_DN98041_c0_g1_i1.p1 TRINITY_DN98041_c0_g1~~TRINITY_DN98041_c0_g1_i1.p1  ORF type:complete len:341 (+),score=43.65 TRINITY_DN98041_c0_g1_i1:97-1023(+)